MKDLYIEDIKARAEGATPGLWKASSFGRGIDEPDCIVIHTGAFNWNAIDKGDTVIASTPAWDAEAARDADFISHAREDIPKLIAEVERDRGAIQGAAAMLRLTQDDLHKCDAEISRLREVIRKVRDLSKYKTIRREDDQGNIVDVIPAESVLNIFALGQVDFGDRN